MNVKRSRPNRPSLAETEPLDLDGTGTDASTEATEVGALDAGAATYADPIADRDKGTDTGVPAGPAASGAKPPSYSRREILNRDRVVGLIVASAVGDALGWPQEDRSHIVGGDAARFVSPRPEFRTWERSAGTQYGRYTDPVFAGEYSDDTQLMLAVARACHHRGWLDWLTRVELPMWPVYQRGGGGAVLTASNSWGSGKPPWLSDPTFDSLETRPPNRVAKYFDAGANGVAMRIGPHVVVTAHEPDETNLIRRVIADGVTTHGHPRALLGGVVHALALRHALLQEDTLEYGELLDHLYRNAAWRDPTHLVETVPPGWLEAHAEQSRGDANQPPELLWSRTCEEVEQLLSIAISSLSQGATANDQRTLTDIGVFDKQRSGAGTVTAVAAAYIAARTASRPMGGLLRSGFLRNADTDTLCSMTGALLGATHGTGWLNHLFAQVQDRDYLISIASTLAAIGDGTTSTDDRPPTSKLPTTASNRLWVKNLFDGQTVERAPDGRSVTVQRISPLPTRTKQFMARAVLHVDDGQTLIVDRTSKTPIVTAESGVAARPALDPTHYAQAPFQDSNLGDAPIQSSIIAGVEVRVSDTNGSALFLQRVFGLPVCTRPNDRLSVGGIIVLAPARGGEVSVDGPAVLHVHAKDLRAVARRAEVFGGVAVKWSEDGRVLWVREPGGLRIRATTPDQNPPG